MYVWKGREELAWAGLVASSLFLLEILAEFKPEAVADWRTWAVAVAGGLVRAAAVGVLAALRVLKPSSQSRSILRSSPSTARPA